MENKEVQPTVETKETTTPVQPVEETEADRLSREIDEAEDRYLGIETAPKEQPIVPAKTAGQASDEFKDTQEQKTEGEPAKEEPKVEEVPKPEEKADGKTEEEITIKYLGEEKKFKLEEVKELAQKGFDYTQKLQKLSDEKRQFEEQKKRDEDQLKYIKLENIAHDVGFDITNMAINPFTQPEPIFMEMAETNGEVKTGKDGKSYQFFNDFDSFTENKGKWQKGLADYQQKAYMVTQNAQQANEKNLEAINRFRDKYVGVDFEQVRNEIMAYANPSVTKGQMPFPEDTFEVFYRGKNFDKLMSEAITKTKKEAYDEALKDFTAKHGKQPVVMSSEKITPEPTEKDEVDVAEDRYIEMKS